MMGHGIAQVHAAIGKRVLLYEPERARAEGGRERIAANLARSVDKGRLAGEDRDRALDLLEATDELERVAEADVVIEAVFEDSDVKRGLWADLDRLARPTTIFATNTSSISIDDLAAAVGHGRRERFLGMHFFSPVPLMPLIELIRGSATNAATEVAIRGLAAELGMQ